MSKTEIPKPQDTPADIYSDTIEELQQIYGGFLQKQLQAMLDFSSVKTVVDLGCGRGINTAGSLIFPNAQVYAVDYWDVLLPHVKDQPRVHFVQNLITEALVDGSIPNPADLIIASFMDRRHGFAKDNIHILSQKCKGFLVTIGDNYGLERESWFQNLFTRQRYDYDYEVGVWKVK